MMDDCIFCKIASGEIPSEKLYEDDAVVAFKDLNPQAPVHFLVVPKQHIKSCAEITEQNSEIAARCLTAVAGVAKAQGLANFRVVSNAGEQAGQTVGHLHFHVLAGRDFSWPPG